MERLNGSAIDDRKIKVHLLKYGRKEKEAQIQNPCVLVDGGHLCKEVLQVTGLTKD